MKMLAFITFHFDQAKILIIHKMADLKWLNWGIAEARMAQGLRLKCEMSQVGNYSSGND